MNRKFISKSNLVLRKVLNKKENIDIIKDIIETFLKIEIIDIRLNPYLKSQAKYLPCEENFGIADVRVKVKNEKELNIGIQFIDGCYVQQKLLLYFSQIHANQIYHAENTKVVKTITINILDFNYFKPEKCHKKILIKEQNTGEKICDDLELHVIELPKYVEKDKSKMTKEDAWISYLIGNNLNIITQRYEKINKLNCLLDEFWKNEKME